MALVTFVLGGSAQASAQRESAQSFDAYVASAMKQWQVPGVAIVVVRGDSVIFAKGYGVREAGKADPVDEHTIFAIGSATKAMTAAALGMLVDEGKIHWDDPVSSLIRGFQFAQPVLTAEVTVRDLLSHRTGLPGNNMVFWGTQYGRDDLVHRVRFIQPTNGIRTKFEYQNIMYLMAGQIIPAVTGKSWDDFLRDRLLVPLGMTSTSTSIVALKGEVNVATPHTAGAGGAQPIPWWNADNVGPAGSVNSNALDMARWVAVQLNDGVYHGSRVFSAAVAREMHTPQMLIEPQSLLGRLFPEAHILTYGMGWFIYDYRGHKVLEHGGDTDGMSSNVALLPDQHVGVVILTNLGGALIRNALTYRAFDRYLDVSPRDWSTDELAVLEGMREGADLERRAAPAPRIANTTPSLPLEQYVGTYHDDLYGDAVVTLENGSVVMRFLGATGHATHWHYDTFQFDFGTTRTQLRGKPLVTFALDQRARVMGLRIAGASLTRAPKAAAPGSP